jgi:hypothetical protein
MSYVGISGELINNVENHISRMRNKERDAFTTPVSMLELSEAPQEVVELLWGEHAHLQNLLPEKWMTKNTGVDLHLNYTLDDSPDANKYSTTFTVKYSTQLMAPPGTSGYRHDISVPMNTCPISLAEDYLKWSKEMSAIEARWATVRKQIVNFLKSCKSLNEALKLWPDVRIYIPEEFLKRVAHKVEREVSVSKAAAALANVDTDAAISAAMTARLMGSMQGLK